MLDVEALLTWLLAALERQSRDHACLAAVVPLLQLCLLARPRCEGVCRSCINGQVRALTPALPAVLYARQLMTPASGVWCWIALHAQVHPARQHAALIVHTIAAVSSSAGRRGVAADRATAHISPGWASE